MVMFSSSNRKLMRLSNLDLIRILVLVLNPNVSKSFSFLGSTLWKCRAGLNISKVVRSWHSSWWLSRLLPYSRNFWPFPELFISTWCMLVFKFLYKLAPAWVLHFISHDFSSQILNSCPIGPLLSQTPSSLLLLVLSCHQESSIFTSLHPTLVLHGLVQISTKFQGLSNSILLRTSPARFS